MFLTKLLTSNNEMKTLQSNHVPPRTNNLVWLRGNAASSHPCKSSGSSYEEFPIPDGLVRSSRPTESNKNQIKIKSDQVHGPDSKPCLVPIPIPTQRSQNMTEFGVWIAEVVLHVLEAVP